MKPGIQSLLRLLAGLAILFIGVFVMKSLVGMKKSPPLSNQEKPIKLIKTLEAAPSDVAPRTYIQGRLVSQQKIEVYAEVGGLLLTTGKEFREGVRYNSGETMLRMDGTELRMSLIAQRSAFLQVLTAALADFKVDYPNSYEKWKTYTSEFNVSESMKPLPTPASDQEKFFISNRGILSQYYNIQASEERLSKYTISAPFSGEVSQALVNPGSLVRVGQKLGEFVGAGRFEIQSAINTSALATVKVGDQVTFTAEDTGKEYKGRVERIVEAIDPATQSASVFCSISGSDLRDGMYFNGVIESAVVADALLLPIALIQPDNQIYTVDDSVLVLTPVEVVYKSERDAVITGLKPGTSVLAEQITNAFSGMSVKVSQ